MTVKEYNEWHMKEYDPTLGFVYCINHAMDKAGDEAIHQMKCIGCGDKIKQTLIEALKALEDKKREEVTR